MLYYPIHSDVLGTPVYIPDRCLFPGYSNDNEDLGKEWSNSCRNTLTCDILRQNGYVDIKKLNKSVIKVFILNKR